jgi:hypothetical protein
MSSANINVDGPAQEPTPQENESSTPEEDLMDLDTPPKPARKVKVPVSKSEWRDPKPATSQPSEVPISSNTQLPSAVPNAVPPPPPPPDSTNTGRKTSVPSFPTQSQPRATTEEPIPPSLNLSSLKDNLSTSGVGIANLSDLNASLPFQSRASTIHPHSTLYNLSPSASFKLTKPPAPPLAPTTIRPISKSKTPMPLSLGLVYLIPQQHDFLKPLESLQAVV